MESSIEEFTYYKKYESFNTKILIRSKSLEDIKVQIPNRYQLHSEPPDFLPNFINTARWWDLDINNIDEYYYGIQQGKIAKTRVIYIFIAKEIKGLRYLYISY